MKKNIILHLTTSVLSIVCILLLCAAQTSLLPSYLNDSYLVADLLLCLVCAIGVLGGNDGGAYGAFAGIFAGLCADSVGGFGICLLPVYYMLCGYVCFVVRELIPYKKFLVYLGTASCLTIGRSVLALIYVMLHTGNVPLPDVIRYVCLPLIPGTLLAMLPMYALALAITLPLSKIQHNSIDKIM